MAGQAKLARAEAEASDWFTRLKRTTISSEELYAFRDWRKDAANAEAFSRVERAWKSAEALQADPDIKAATSQALKQNPKPDLRPRPTVTWKPILPAALAAVLLASGAGWWALRNAPAAYATTVGEQRLVPLEDGSRVRLNTDSQIRVRYGSESRRVELVRGEAFFEVAHDGARPFVVEAGEADVRALGTKFDVRRDAGSVQVTLLQGRVQVAHDRRAGAVMLAPNQALRVTSEGVSKAVAADARETASWTTGRLTFRETPLREAVAEMNRYAKQKIVLEAPADVASDPVTGEFDVGDMASFIAAVTMSFELKSERGPKGDIRLVAPAS